MKRMIEVAGEQYEVDFSEISINDLYQNDVFMMDPAMKPQDFALLLFRIMHKVMAKELSRINLVTMPFVVKAMFTAMAENFMGPSTIQDEIDEIIARKDSEK